MTITQKLCHVQMALTSRVSEALLCAVLKIYHSLYSKCVPVFVTKHLQQSQTHKWRVCYIEVPL